jgi:hypothetical protein
MKLAYKLELIRAFLVYVTLLMVIVTLIMSKSKSPRSMALFLVAPVVARGLLSFLL